MHPLDGRDHITPILGWRPLPGTTTPGAFEDLVQQKHGHVATDGGLIPMSIANYAVCLTSTAIASLIAIARFRSRRSDPKDTANLAQTLDRHLMGEVVSLRDNPLNSIPVN